MSMYVAITTTAGTLATRYSETLLPFHCGISRFISNDDRRSYHGGGPSSLTQALGKTCHFI
jgi:hypothetical protein